MLCAAVFFALILGVTADACWRNTTCAGPAAASFAGPWSSNIYAPESRVVRPKRFFSLKDPSTETNFSDPTAISLNADTDALVFDFGVEVGGIVTVNYTLTGSSNTLGLAFTEARDYVGKGSDNSNGGSIDDGALTTTIDQGSGTYVMPDAQMRGGFRYMTLFLGASSSNSTLQIDDVALELSFQPTWPDLRAYQGYFHSSEELLNRIWYSGAYTMQVTASPSSAGRASVKSRAGWSNNQNIGPGDTVLLDGAKRDRWVWIGDMGTAVPSAFVSTGDLASTKNALQAIYDGQASSGVLPKAGPPYLSKDSETYHLWALIGTYNYFLYSGDQEFLQSVWSKYTAAVNYTLGHLTSDGILQVVGEADWGRWTYSTQRSSASMLLYHALTTGAAMASWVPELADAANISTAYTKEAESLQKAIVDQFWDDSVGAFEESPNNTDLYPQDANSLAIAFGVLPAGSDSALQVSDYLESNWTPIGPSCPELAGNISPFVSSIELLGHFQAGRPDRALQLMRDSWGWYANHPNGTQSTVVEGFLVDGSWGYRGDRGYRNDPSYVSHAHGWSSGPTFALSEYMLGLRVTKPQGSEWRLAPATFGELSEVQAGFTTALGKFSAKFVVEGGNAIVSWDTPAGTRGRLKLPGQGARWVKGGKGSVAVRIN